MTPTQKSTTVLSSLALMFAAAQGAANTSSTGVPTPEDVAKEMEIKRITDKEVHDLAQIPEGTPATDLERVRLHLFWTLSPDEIRPGMSGRTPLKVFHTLRLKGDDEALTRLKAGLIEQARATPELELIAEVPEAISASAPGLWVDHRLAEATPLTPDDIRRLWDQGEPVEGRSFLRLCMQLLQMQYLRDAGEEVLEKALEARQIIFEVPRPEVGPTDAPQMASRMGIGILRLRGREAVIGLSALSTDRNDSVQVILDPAELKLAHEIISPLPPQPRYLPEIDEIEDGALSDALGALLAGTP